jgi:16S rRNA processing protein RimM
MPNGVDQIDETDARICVGAIAGPSGVRGDVKIKSFTQEPEDVVNYGPVETEDGSQTFVLKMLRSVKGGISARIEGINSREKAEGLKGTKLYISRDMLPELDDEEFFIEDLVGLKAIRTDGRDFGIIKTVQNHGAGDFLEITLVNDMDANRVVDLPFTLAIVPKVSIEDGVVTVDPPEALDPEVQDAEKAAKKKQRNAKKYKRGGKNKAKSDDVSSDASSEAVGDPSAEQGE